MRSVFFKLLMVIMIALLPLRGWAGNVMAVDMAGKQVAAAQIAAVSGAEISSSAAMPADCPMLTQAAGTDDPVEAGAHCSCDTCDLCLALASVKDTNLAAATFTPHTAPQAASAGFSSADRAHGLKPPIS